MEKSCLGSRVTAWPPSQVNLSVRLYDPFAWAKSWQQRSHILNLFILRDCFIHLSEKNGDEWFS